VIVRPDSDFVHVITQPAHAALAQAYLQNKDPDAARIEARRALALDPASAEATDLLGRIVPQ